MPNIRHLSLIISISMLGSACTTTPRRQPAWEIHHTGRIEASQHIQVTEYGDQGFGIFMAGKVPILIATGRAKVNAHKYLIRTRNLEIVEVEARETFAVGTCVDIYGLETDPGGLTYIYQTGLLRTSERCTN